MAYKDGTKSGGRKPGSKNKLTLLKAKIRADAIAKLNDDLGPDAFKGNAVAFLQAIYKSPNFDPDMRMEAATRVAQFESPKKSESTIDDKREYVVRMPARVGSGSLEDWKKQQPETAEQAAADDAAWSEKLASFATAAENKTRN